MNIVLVVIVAIGLTLAYLFTEIIEESKDLTVSTDNLRIVFTDIDTASLIGNLKDGAGSIVEASSSIVFLSSNLFDSLPSEVKALIIAVFTIFIILIIFKFIVTLL